MPERKKPLTGNIRGFSIVEVLVAIGMIAFVIVSVSKIGILVRKAGDLSEDRFKALSYAQEWLEIMNIVKDDAFACRCGADICSSGVCTRTTDGRTCNLSSGYLSCWTEYPVNGFALSEFKLVPDAGAWRLDPAGGVSDPCPDPRFSRFLKVTNLRRNAAGALDPAGTPDPGTKEIEVAVTYESADTALTASLKTILTAWEDTGTP